MLNNYKILAVNNDSAQLETLRAILRQANFTAATARDADEGLALAARQTPDLIVYCASSANMTDFCRAVRADEKLRAVPILLINATAENMPRVLEAVENGADDYLEAACDEVRLVAKATQMIERRRRDDAVRSGENRFRSLIENSRDIITILATDGTIKYESPALKAVLGFEPEELIGKKAFEFMHPEDAAQVRDFFRQALGGVINRHKIEYRHRHKNGSWTILESVGKKFDDPYDGISVVINSRDVTEQCRAVVALRASREHLTLAQQVAKIGSFEWNLQTGDIIASPEMCLLYGISPAIFSVRLEDWMRFVHPEDAAKVERKFAETLKSGEFEEEFRIVRRDESVRWICATAKVFYDETGAARRLVGVNLDITEKKRAESALRFQKSLLEAQSEASIDGILVSTPGGEIISHNQRFSEMWEIPDAVLATKSDAAFLDSVLDKLVNRQEFLDKVSYLYEHPDETNHVEVALKDKRTFERYSAPVLDADKTFLGRIWHFRDVTERKQAEQKLRQSEERYRLLFESNPLPMWVYSLENLRFLAVNAAAILHYGYSREEFLSMTIKDIRPPEDIPALLKQVAKANGGISAAGFWKHLRKDGAVIDVEITSHEVAFAEERAELVLAHDVTERKKAEDAIRFQAHLLDTVEQAVIATDFDGIVIYWNRFAEQLYGWSAAEAANRHITDLTTPEIGQEKAVEIMSRLKNGKSWSGEFSVQHKSGETFPARVFNSPIHDDNGGDVIGTIGVSFDITESRRAEEALRQAEIRYRNLVELSPAIVYLAEPNPPYAPIYVSPNVEVFGYRVEEWFSRRDMWLSLIHEDDRERVLQITEDAMRHGLNTEIEYRIVARNGQIHTVHDKGRFIADENGDVIGWQGVILDITETKKLEEQLRLSQKLESVGRLAGGIAHDFNNMLTAINGYSGMILRQLGADDPLRSKVQEIKKAGERSAALTHQLLAFSRQQILKPKVLSINEIIVDTTNMLERLIGEDIQLNISPGLTAGQVEVDPNQLTQVILNLAVNARDAMPDGGNLTFETANVYLDEEAAALHPPTAPGAYVLLSVSDSGSGMDDDIRKHIFEPFYTTKAVGKGTGLGLATVYGIVKQSNGYIWVESKSGKGTTFKIYFPRADKPAFSGGADTAANGEIISGGETILLVEDEEVIRNLAREILETCGYTVIEAKNGVEALEICRRADYPIDLLITDVVMPKMGGREAAKRIAEIFPDTPQLFISGYTDDNIFRQGLINEETNFIQKPFTFETLAYRVRKLLDEKDSERRANFL